MLSGRRESEYAVVRLSVPSDICMACSTEEHRINLGDCTHGVVRSSPVRTTSPLGKAVDPWRRHHQPACRRHGPKRKPHSHLAGKFADCSAGPGSRSPPSPDPIGSPGLDQERGSATRWCHRPRGAATRRRRHSTTWRGACASCEMEPVDAWGGAGRYVWVAPPSSGSAARRPAEWGDTPTLRDEVAGHVPDEVGGGAGGIQVGGAQRATRPQGQGLPIGTRIT